MPQRWALIGVRLIDGTGADPVERAVVVVEEGVIVEAGPEATVRRTEDAHVIDASGTTLMPGIVDGHCHLGGATHLNEVDWVLEDDTFQAINSVAQADALLRHGVTTVRDISVNGPHLRKAIDHGSIDGPRIIPCWRGLSRRGGHGDAPSLPPDLVRRSHPWGYVADGPDEVRAGVREIVKNGSRCIKVWASGGGLHDNEPEDVQHYSLEELQVIVREAYDVRVPVAVHAECASAARDAATAGAWSIEHGEDLDEEAIELMVAKGISLNPTLVLLRQWVELSAEFGGVYGKPYIPGGGEVPSEKEAVLKLHHERLSANLMRAKKAGVRIGVGSDSFCTGFTPFGQQTLHEVRALVAAGLSEMEAIVAATKSGAEILRVDDVTGTIQRGKAADLLVLRDDPLDDIACIDEGNMLLIVKATQRV
jgi:imidazolonepropionase-like amidohydrolase